MTLMTESPFVDMAAKLFDHAEAKNDGFDAALWKVVEESGLDRLLVAEELGGAGDVFGDAAGVMFAAGARAVSIPLLETMLVNRMIAGARQAIAPGPKALIAWPDLGDESKRSGDVGCVWGAQAVDIVLINPDGSKILNVVSGTSGTGETVAGEPIAWLPREMLGAGTSLTAAHGNYDLDLALVLTMQAAAMAGAMQSVCDMSVAYANDRIQFGRPIARFQAIQHMAATLASEAAATRSAVEVAIAGLNSERPLWAAAIAKARASEAAGSVTACAHQIHGAIGYTREYDLHMLSRRLWAWRERYGNETYWYGRIGRAALGHGPGGLWPALVQGMVL